MPRFSDSFWLFEQQRVELLVMELNGRAASTFPVQLVPFEQKLRKAGYRTFLVATHPATQDTILAELPPSSFAQWNIDIETLIAIPQNSSIIDDSGFTLVPAGMETALLVDQLIVVLTAQEPCGRKLFRTDLVLSCFMRFYRLAFTLRSRTKKKRRNPIPIAAYLHRKTADESSFH